eukprot:COSAG04_NODE_12465_length_651_cov_1.030797_2_plen_119_part_01
MAEALEKAAAVRPPPPPPPPPPSRPHARAASMTSTVLAWPSVIPPHLSADPGLCWSQEGNAVVNPDDEFEGVVQTSTSPDLESAVSANQPPSLSPQPMPERPSAEPLGCVPAEGRAGLR